MKDATRTIITWFAKKILKKYQPVIVGVTGSFGKTSTKDAITLVLRKRYRVRGSQKNYNNEFGVPLTIIGAESGGRSPMRWLGIFLRATALMLRKKRSYPEVLVLEMGADRPGDIGYLVELAPCHIGVVTAVGPVHLEFFGTQEKITKEKSVMVRHLAKDALAVLNADDRAVYAMREKTKATVVTYGFSGHAEVRALELEREDKNLKAHAMRFKLQTEAATVPVALYNLLGKHQVYPVLAAAAVGKALGMNLVDIAGALAHYTPPRGRMRLLDGIKNTLLIDDTYNASYESTLGALEALSYMHVGTQSRKVAVLGDMLELGTTSKEAHVAIGAYVAQHGVNLLLTVGSLAKSIAVSAKESGMPEDHIFSFDTAEAAGKFLQKRMREGDVALLKGSQGMHIEKVVKEVMAEPLRAGELLVRQGKEWQ
ncbi:MAG: hypothetical protein COT39_00905 [Parcubacteria group bacterium CG08_land_8_20_14_0_20_48_21]|nr:MAG: hypothetical protein AUK21_02270 [Parcubacteria group bacterium CG2_30_48_51]PIS33016.1 MAG: hypothetical protein COT39_00905 [Parcubacteria group bacterium CG08_land_8_20_14_0_20_48_21]PIW79092.1 MAG: hypothetical protein COZ99_02835 [Parcubacteria group bacterium CG_4_8_14_3_um_filter_48_16]PIY78229.1 MAG: hypothetical protein COY83_01115 [Parcubacteria group bacterium CG_4_10_14_0_8_um_filter_48_154]PIZ78074.1 MAG: hypothetical protein COY03_00565 [bacterium CG_4_10_14_0_2_um_filter_